MKLRSHPHQRRIAHARVEENRTSPPERRRHSMRSANVAADYASSFVLVNVEMDRKMTSHQLSIMAGKTQMQCLLYFARRKILSGFGERR
jgi:hypothetical protein